MRFLLSALMLMWSVSSASACDVDRPVVFAGLDWQSNAFHTAVAQFILEQGFECETDVVPGTTIPLLQGVAQGDVDVVMEEPPFDEYVFGHLATNQRIDAFWPLE